jgi:glycosyltransferase involved in cell wall biosynthesis
VLLVIKSLGYGGAERLVADLVAAGNKTASERSGRVDYEVAYLLAGQDALAPFIEASGTPVHCLGSGGNLDLGWMRAFRDLLLAGHYDIVHFHLPYTAALGRLVVLTLPRHRRPATMYTEHSLWNKVAVLVKMLNRATVRRDRALIAVSQAAYDHLPRDLQPRTRVVVHGVDLARSRSLAARRGEIRASVRAELEVPPGALLVLAIANLRSEKGYDVLLDTAALLIEQGLPVRFAAAGKGAQLDELVARHRELGLGDRFRFLGHREDALELLVAADVFVLASHQEGLPVVLMEAGSIGAAIVATTVGGVPQVVTDGVNGLLVPPGDPAALAGALARLCSDPDLREKLGRQAMEDSSRYDIGRAAAEIEGLYWEVVDREA